MVPPLFHSFLQKGISHWGKLDTTILIHIEWKSGGAIRKLFPFFVWTLGPNVEKVVAPYGNFSNNNNNKWDHWLFSAHTYISKILLERLKITSKTNNVSLQEKLYSMTLWCERNRKGCFTNTSTWGRPSRTSRKWNLATHRRHNIYIRRIAQYLSFPDCSKLDVDRECCWPCISLEPF